LKKENITLRTESADKNTLKKENVTLSKVDLAEKNPLKKENVTLGVDEKT
jgi:hypothetical protein